MSVFTTCSSASLPSSSLPHSRCTLKLCSNHSPPSLLYSPCRARHRKEDIIAGMLRSHTLTDATEIAEQTTTTVEEAAIETEEATVEANRTVDDATLHTQHEAPQTTTSAKRGTNN